MNDERDRKIRALASRPPGYEQSDPYEDLDCLELPHWWRYAIEEFDAHGLRPYRPPRFEDGEHVHDHVEKIERTWNVEIQFIAFGNDDGENWEIRIDGEKRGEIGHHRSPEGYSVYEMESEAFIDYVESTLSELHDDR